MAWAPDYVDLSAMKAFARIPGTADDAQVALAITAASRAVDRSCSRQFGKVDAPEQRVYTARYDRHRARHAWVVDIDDLASVTGLTITVNGIAVTDYKLESRNAVAKGKVWTLLVLGHTAETPSKLNDYEVGITASWGWPAIPASVQEATMLQAYRFHKRRDSPFGVAGSLADGSELRLFADVDPDVKVSLSDFVRRWSAVGSPVPMPHVHYPWGWYW